MRRLRSDFRVLLVFLFVVRMGTDNLQLSDWTPEALIFLSFGSAALLCFRYVLRVSVGFIALHISRLTCVGGQMTSQMNKYFSSRGTVCVAECHPSSASFSHH